MTNYISYTISKDTNSCSRQDAFTCFKIFNLFFQLCKLVKHKLNISFESNFMTLSEISIVSTFFYYSIDEQVFFHDIFCKNKAIQLSAINASSSSASGSRPKIESWLTNVLNSSRSRVFKRRYCAFSFSSMLWSYKIDSLLHRFFSVSCVVTRWFHFLSSMNCCACSLQSSDNVIKKNAICHAVWLYCFAPRIIDNDSYQ